MIFGFWIDHQQLSHAELFARRCLRTVLKILLALSFLLLDRDENYLKQFNSRFNETLTFEETWAGVRDVVTAASVNFPIFILVINCENPKFISKTKKNRRNCPLTIN